MVHSSLLIPELIEELCKDFEDALDEDETAPRVSNRRHAPRQRDTGYGLRELNALTDKQFTRYFRLNGEAFYWLLNKIKPHIEDQTAFGRPHHHENQISAETKLYCALRWLAGGSYLDITFAFRVSTSAFFLDRGILWRTLAAIDFVLPLGFPLNDPQRLEKISEGFSKFSHGRMRGCATAIDGLVIKTRCPNLREVVNQIAYRNRNGMWGIISFAGCDHELRFTMWSTVCPGSTNDSLAWELSDLYRAVVCGGLLPEQYFFICDEAVVASENVFSPFGGRGIGILVVCGNASRAFGLLTRRWGILWRPLTCDFNRWTMVTRVCAKLHKLCIDFKVGGTRPGDNSHVDTDSSYGSAASCSPDYL